MGISSMALQGLEQASAQFDTAASGSAGIAAAQIGTALDTVTLSRELIALMASKNAFAANIDVLKTADQIQQSALNAFA